MYASGSTGPVKGSLGVHSWDQSMGLAVLRRDGFSYMTAANGTTAVLTTRCAPSPSSPQPLPASFCNCQC